MTNVEEVHARWFSEIADFAWRYLGSRHGHKPSQAAILEMRPDEIIFETKALFELPAGSGILTLHMARFAKCTSGGDVVGLTDLGIDKLPETTFCLNSLLTAAFPRNTETGIFKFHDGAVGIGEPEDPKFQGRAPHVAFAGVGIILMDKTRQHVEPLATDNEIIRLADRKYLAIFD